MVGSMAWRVWTSVVTHTPSTLKRILPKLLNNTLRDLGSDLEECRVSAGDALADLVAKMGDDVLAVICPLLQSRLSSDQDFVRQGACLGVNQLLVSSPKQHLVNYLQDLVSVIQGGLSDSSAMVRVAAGHSFAALANISRAKAVDEIVPPLLEKTESSALTEEEREHALDGIRQVLMSSAQDALPMVMTRLARQPVSVENAYALQFLCTSFGPAFSRYIRIVLESLAKSWTLAAVEDRSDDCDLLLEYTEAILLQLGQESVANCIEALQVIMQQSKSEFVNKQCLTLLSKFTETKCDLDYHLQSILHTYIEAFDSPHPSVITIVIKAITAFGKRFEDNKLHKHIPMIRNTISNMVNKSHDGKKARSIPALDKKGLVPLFPIFRAGLMKGNLDLKKEAVLGLGELITLTPAKSLGALSLKITGALIRMVGDRFPPPIKSALINLLGVLLRKVPVLLKTVLPQLRTSCLRAIQDEFERYGCMCISLCVRVFVYECAYG
jgi:hypothetical protein